MSEVDPDWVSAGATVFAGVATLAAAVASCFAYKLQRAITKGRQQLLKGDDLLKNMQLLIATFADVHATAKQDWSPERTEKLRSLDERLRYTETVIKSLNPQIGEQVEQWRISSDAKGDSVTRVVSLILGGTGAIIGAKYDDFLFSKAAQLREIQDSIFNEMST
ncbi:hypothetical protein BZG72_04325 [Salinivibrio sp. PR6]|uniref:hypothetical protein n=1 Tax=Salinivibrio sp. PR6 TaxID=1909485 RepID=UPI000988E58D|nr:hypothetical protein [Salinivibrio sp. PR6]OOE84025.1 hypothetical protein BZG72_04325 [Salinivibrio sp. PR6]